MIEAPEAAIGIAASLITIIGFVLKALSAANGMRKNLRGIDFKAITGKAFR